MRDLWCSRTRLLCLVFSGDSCFFLFFSELSTMKTLEELWAKQFIVCLFGVLQVDILGWKKMFLPLKWIGMNAMLVYVMGAEGILAAFFNGWYYRDPHNTLVKTCLFLPYFNLKLAIAPVEPNVIIRILCL